ncbi:RidA family protein [Pseudomonas sp. Teo4]|uniref:RidA family protein n=1 Tax=Pseudomonas sp. Teo4 TaxID=3064528 RepID=UPI002AB9BB82|nr:RidA family protein [Pseudomonas sp. Teo4]MDZ3992418.1 hypothetical protein [Pseudomonas sp. Teo4]
MTSKYVPPVLSAGLGLVMAGAASAEVLRHPIPGSDFPVALAIEIPASTTLVNFSGAVPRVTAPENPRDSIAAYGDTERQTVDTLEQLRQSLEKLGLGMGDIVRMQVFLVGDPALNGRMDFAGFMRGYQRFFGNASQPLLPTRSVVQVAGLANPGFLVEIEISAARR